MHVPSTTPEGPFLVPKVPRSCGSPLNCSSFRDDGRCQTFPLRLPVLDSTSPHAPRPRPSSLGSYHDPTGPDNESTEVTDTGRTTWTVPKKGPAPPSHARDHGRCDRTVTDTQGKVQGPLSIVPSHQDRRAKRTPYPSTRVRLRGPTRPG